ncbi:MAG: L-threonylcarbamoyladenylate synthase [Anaerolineales bacterium]
MTQVFTLNPLAPHAGHIQHAAQLLRAGRLVAFPTETVYGLGANALDPEAVARIFIAKGRPVSDPLIVHLASFAQLTNVAREIPPVAEQLARQFWPGPLTLVLHKHPSIPSNVTAGQDTVAVRVPANPIALALIRAADLPIAAPSANLFGRTSPTNARHVLEDLAGRIDLILDGGETQIGLESTVLDITQTPPRILRPGGIPFERLQRILPDLVLHAVYQAESSPAKLSSPGTLLKHYAPKARLTLLDGDRETCLAQIQTLVTELTSQGQKVGLLLTEEDAPALRNLLAEQVILGSETDLEQVGRHLFAGLRELDRRGVDAILVHTPPKTSLGLTIWDRLYRAAQGNVLMLAKRD